MLIATESGYNAGCKVPSPPEIVMKMKLNVIFCFFIATLLTASTGVFHPCLDSASVSAQEGEVTSNPKYSRADRLRGSVTPERAWWDLKHYDLAIEVFPKTKSLKGSNTVSFTTLGPGKKMQIDLQPPLKITKVLHGEAELKYEREGSVYWIYFENELAANADDSVTVFYEGKPVVSTNPPWSGGISWQNDEKGNPFIATSCQGIGASIWWPTKDHGYDEPDRGMDFRITVPKSLVAVANGRLVETLAGERDMTHTFHWQVTNPINNYCINMNIGNYVSFSETFKGEGGDLDVEYWVLDHQRETAKKHFKEAPRTLKAFEHWFGKYPFYEDSYKLVVVPYLGMEHQSSVTYGNGFKNGYRGRDLSETGVGMKFDFIIVHESGHEWFGNNISMKDVADMWIHESFTNYSENLFVEYHFTEKEAQDYVIGCRKLINNKSPIIGAYDVNQKGNGGDMYYKGGNMIHTIRHVINDDEKWRSILRGLNENFWHKTVTTQEVESFINEKSGIDFSKYFDQYLRDTRIPVLNYQIDGEQITYHFTEVVDGFSIRIKVNINGEEVWIKPTGNPQTLKWNSEIKSISVDRNFYIKTKTKG
ncbi:MAG: M1 family metallopeptidase [Mariniblastus sp.]|nr:M1 family metallopeptidase [Mariniblastus sp.]